MSRIVVTGRFRMPPSRSSASSTRSTPGRAGVDQPEELLRRVAGADAILSLLTERVDGELLDAAGPQLKVVANVAVGYDNIDVAACRERGVVATNTPGVLTEATADIAFGLLLMATRRLGEANASSPARRGSGACSSSSAAACRARPWASWAWAASARRRHAAPRPSAWTSSTSRAARSIPTSRPSWGAAGRARRAAGRLDVVSLHCPYGPATHHLIGAEQFTAMKSSAYLVNTARGPIVDEAALATLRCATARSPAPASTSSSRSQGPPRAPRVGNVALVPHLGSATIETRTAMATLAADNALAVLRGEAATTPIG